MRRLVIVLSLFTGFITSHAQDHVIDSLKLVVQTTTNDSTRAEALGDLSWFLKYSDPASAIAYGLEGAALARENDFDALEAYALNSVGVTYWAKGDFDSGAFYITQVTELYKALNHKRGEAMTYTNLGLIFQYKGDYQLALEYGLKAVRMLFELKDTAAVASPLLNVGNVYFLREEFQMAKVYYFKSLALKLKTPNPTSGQNLQKTLGNIANVYQKLGQHDSAFYYFKAAIPYALEANDTKNLCLAYTELGRTFSMQGQYDSALYYYGKSLAIYEDGKFENEYDRATLLVSFGQTYMEMGDIGKARWYAEEHLALAKKLNNVNKLLDAYALLALVYERNGRPAMALDAMKNYIVFKDSVANTEKSKQIAEIQTKYETERKDNEILLLSRENELKEAAITKRNWLISTLTLAIGIVALAFVVWRNHQRQKHLREKQEQHMRFREAQIRAEIESQENERKRFAQDLHDGMGQTISALKLMLQSLPSDAPLSDRIAVVERSELLLNDMHAEIRRIAFNLMPAVLVQHGLVTALNESAQRINASGRVVMRVSSYDMPKRLPEVQEISLYRIAQEWINNVLKYAEATLIEVQLLGYESELVITIEDNGRGFNPARLESSEGNGWKNIRSRLSLIKGTCELDTDESRQGTTFILRVPVGEVELAPMVSPSSVLNS